MVIAIEAETETVRILKRTNGTDTFIVQVRDNDDWHTSVSGESYDAVAPYANLAHRVMRNTADAADAVAAAVVTHLQHTNVADNTDMTFDEKVEVSVNMLLGYCADGCCGGDECLEEDEIPAFLQWARRLRRAVGLQLLTAPIMVPGLENDQ